MATIKKTTETVANGYATVITAAPQSPPLFQLLAQIIRNGIPYLLFVFFYCLNVQIHLVPRYSDINCIHLYNISAIEHFIIRFSPHLIVSSFSYPVFDFLSAIPYLMHYGLPFIYPVYLYWKGQLEDINKFYWLLGWVMWSHFFTWFVFPTAPPWVYDILSLQKSSNATLPPLNMQHKEGCAFARLDSMLGTDFFFNMFNGNPVPFGSFPSGHVAWPTVIYCISPPGGKIFLLYIFYVTWATLYSCHHYLSDAIFAIAGVYAMKRLLQYFSERTSLQKDSYYCSCSSIACPLHIV